MSKFETTNNYKDIVLNNIPLIDVRAPIEYEKGAFINAINIPILNNEERHVIGVCYKSKGNEEATKLGYKIVSGKVKEERLNKWVKFKKDNPKAMIYCFRGGSRSTIAQQWIKDEGNIEIIKLQGGYKAFRNYLIESIRPENISLTPMVLSGYTGSGKTILLNEINNSIDLEGLANHRGSAFGHNLTPQPSQINFENNLAYDIIKLNESNYKHMIIEDEGKSIGKNFIPIEFFNFFHNSKVIMLDCSMEERINNILVDYVINAQKNYINGCEDSSIGLHKWYDDIKSSIERVKMKLGGDRCIKAISELNKAFDYQNLTDDYNKHGNWISILLENYYDPLYKHSITKGNREVIFTGNKSEVQEYINSIEK